MGGITKTIKKLTSAVTKPLGSVGKTLLNPAAALTDSNSTDTSSTATQVVTPAVAASDVAVAGTTPSTDTEDSSTRKGLMRSAKGKKALTVSRASGGGLNV